MLNVQGLMHVLPVGSAPCATQRVVSYASLCRGSCMSSLLAVRHAPHREWSLMLLCAGAHACPPCWQCAMRHTESGLLCFSVQGLMHVLPVGSAPCATQRVVSYASLCRRRLLTLIRGASRGTCGSGRWSSCHACSQTCLSC